MTDPEADGGGSGAAASPEAAELLALVDRLGVLLEENDLAELEVESGPTRVILRRAEAQMQVTEYLAPPVASGSVPVHAPHADVVEALPAVASTTRAVIAPLTGIYYESPAPGSAPYVQVGSEIVVGQVIGLIEAMKLFNEIKSDVAGRVVRLVAESGALVKAKQALLEVEPL